MAEFDVLHTQKKEDFELITTDYLDNEIAFYERVQFALVPSTNYSQNPAQVISRLKTARHLFDVPVEELELVMPGPRQPSIYEKDLSDPRLRSGPLPQPSPHIFDSKPIRPVSAAIGGVGMFFGSTASS